MPDAPLKCMNCGAATLVVRKREGFGMAMVLLSGKRKYVCMNCKHAFRAFDRRRSQGESPESH